MIPDASRKLRNAADLLDSVLPMARAVYGYLEGDVLRHLGGDERKRLLVILADLRAEYSPGAPSWAPENIEAIKAKLITLADDIAETEPVRLTRKEWKQQLAKAREEGAASALSDIAMAPDPRILNGKSQPKRQEA